MITITNGILTAKIDEKGAQLTSLATANHEYIYDNPAVWKKHAPVLFPFAGRHKDQKFSFEGKEYGPVQIHGFAPYADYTAEDKTDSAVRLKMVVSEDIRAVWPFEFAFSVEYALRDCTLFVTYEVENLGSKTMYYGMGSHPGFNVPMKEGLAFEDYCIEFPEGGDFMRNLMSDACLDIHKQEPYPLKNKRLPLRHDLFDHDAVILSGMGKTAVIRSGKDSRKVIVTFPDTAYCALWHTVKAEVPFVCIEPWTSLPGDDGVITALETKKDYNALKAGGCREHHLNITVID